MITNESTATVNTALSEAINASGYKRKFVAEKAKISRALLWQLERGHDFDTELGYRLADILNTTIDAISLHSPVNASSVMAGVS